jgi:hypothetical protein
LPGDEILDHGNDSARDSKAGWLIRSAA